MNIKVVKDKVLHKGKIYNTGDIIPNVAKETAVILNAKKITEEVAVEYEESEVFDCFTAPIADVKKLGKDLGLTFKRGMEEAEIRQLVNDTMAAQEDVETGVEMHDGENDDENGDGEMPNTDMPE